MSTNKILLAAALIAGFAGSASAVEDPAKGSKPAEKMDKVAEKPCPAPVKKHHKHAPKPVHHAPVHHHHHHAPEGLKVTLGGELDTQIGYRKQKRSYDTVQPGVLPVADGVDKTHKFAIVNDTRISVKAEGKGHGFGYGGIIVLNSDTSDNKFGWNPYTDNDTTDMVKNDKVGFKTKIWVRNQWGSLEAGSTTGAYAYMRVNAANYARATGGIDGDSQYWWNPLLLDAPTAVIRTTSSIWVPEAFVINPNLPSNYVHGLDAHAAKVSYFTPTWMGFKFGVSYTPDSEQRGTVSKTHSVYRNRALTPTLTGYKNVWEGGISYKGHFDKIGIRASLMGNAGDAKDYAIGGVRVERDDLRAWEAGAALSYMGFTLAGSYADLDDSGTPKTLVNGTTPLTGKDDASFWNLGLSYECHHFGASVTYMESRRAPTIYRNEHIGVINMIHNADSSNKFNNLSFGVDYKLAPGFMPYAEVSRFSMKSGRSGADARYKNSGIVVLAGTKLHF